MKVNYFPETDSLYIDLSEQPSVESREILREWCWTTTRPAISSASTSTTRVPKSSFTGLLSARSQRLLKRSLANLGLEPSRPLSCTVMSPRRAAQAER